MLNVLDGPIGQPNVEPIISSKPEDEKVVLTCNNPVDDEIQIAISTPGTG